VEQAKKRVSTMIQSKQNLIEADRELPYPFTIPLSDGSVLTCEKSLRILPKNRLTMQGKWQDKNVVAKVFISKSAKRHAKRDQKGIEKLHFYKFNAPEILYAGTAKWKGVYVVLYEFLSSAQKVKQAWEQASDIDSQTDLISKLAQTLARQHAVGMLQTDLHLNNFLLKRARIYCLDGDGITFARKPKPLSIRKSFHNLAMFLENLTNNKPEHIKTAFIEYCSCRNITINDTNYKRLLKVMQSVRSRMNKKQMEKTLRDCSSFVCHKSSHQFVVYDRQFETPAMSALMQNPEIAFQDASAEYLKKGNTCTIIKVPVDEHVLVIKRYNIKNIAHGLKQLFRKTRARRSWLSAHYLRLLSINTIKPIGLHEKKLGPCHFQAYFIAEYNEGHAIDQFDIQDEQALQYLESIADDFVVQLNTMFEKGITHGDLKASNLLIRSGKVTWLDLDSVKFHHNKFSFGAAKKADLIRFMKNFENDRKQYNFWQKYIEQL